jgi:hypothetical protein
MNWVCGIAYIALDIGTFLLVEVFGESLAAVEVAISHHKVKVKVWGVALQNLAMFFWRIAGVLAHYGLILVGIEIEQQQLLR